MIGKKVLRDRTEQQATIRILKFKNKKITGRGMRVREQFISHSVCLNLDFLCDQ